MRPDGCSCRNALLPSHLRSEPEEVNVASSVVAMGRSGVAGRRVCAGRMPTLPCAQISIDAQPHLKVDQANEEGSNLGLDGEKVFSPG
jgi:hypothetical protein